MRCPKIVRDSPRVALHHRIYATDLRPDQNAHRGLRGPEARNFELTLGGKLKDEPLVVLLHGLGSRGEDWAFQIKALQSHYRVLTVDLRGHGETAMLPGLPTIADLAADVTHLLAALEAGAVDLVGLSLGGGVALQIAVDNPELVRSLTIVNAAATLRPGLRRLPSSLVRLALLFSGKSDALGWRVGQGLFPQDAQSELRSLVAKRLAEASRSDYLRAILAILRFNLKNRVHGIGVPTLVLAGEYDKTIPLRSKQALAAAIPGARLAVIEGSGHATPLDAPDQFNRLLLDFLAEHGLP